MEYFFEFLVSVINYYHINGLHLFWDSFEWFLSSNKLWQKYFSSLVKGIVIKVQLLLLYIILKSDKKKKKKHYYL